MNWGSYIISIAKSTSKKIGASIRSVKFLSPEVALRLLCISVNLPYDKYCCHIWAGTPSCDLEMLDKLQKRICRTVGPSLAVFLEPLAHHRNIASLILFYRHYFSPRYYKDVYVNSFFPRTARLWDFLPIPLTYDLNGFISLEITSALYL